MVERARVIELSIKNLKTELSCSNVKAFDEVVKKYETVRPKIIENEVKIYVENNEENTNVLQTDSQD